MPISPTAATAREGARQRDGKFGSYVLSDAGDDADLDLNLDLSWLSDEAVDGDFGADLQPDIPALRDVAMQAGGWLRSNAHIIGWDDDEVAGRRRANGQAPPAPLNAEAERRVRETGAALAARAAEISGIDIETEQSDYAHRTDTAMERWKDIETEQREIESASNDSKAAQWFIGQITSGRVGAFTQQMADRAFTGKPDLHTQAQQLASRRSLAARDLAEVKAGTDRETRKVLSQLSEGYLAALAETRDLGGELTTHEKSTKPAAKAFAEAMSVYPTDWVQASNSRDQQPVAKISRKRAHYTEAARHQEKKRVWSGHEISMREDDYESRKDGVGTSYEPTGRIDEHSGLQIYQARYWKYTYPGQDPDRTPKGRGWEFHEPTGRWRQPSMRMKLVSSQVAPEILTNKREHELDGRSETFSVAVHESAHRFEASVPQIKDLERSFLDRRCRDEQGNLKPLQSIRPMEYARDGGFAAEYIGREYDSGDREVLSCGAEAIFGGRYGGLVGLGPYAADTDHRDFVLGLMATAGRRD